MKFRHTNQPFALALAFVLALAACGDGNEAADSNATEENPRTEQSASLDGGDEGSSPLICPPDVRDGLAGPDILDLKLGMTVEEALGTARCALGEAAMVKTEDRWLDDLRTYGVKLGTQTFTVQSGDHKECNFQRNWQGCGFGLREWEHVDDTLVVATPGAPGNETAMAIWRTQHFREGQMPPVQTVIEALIAKYGEPQVVRESNDRRGYSAGYRDLQWVRDQSGKPLSNPNPLFGRCKGAVRGEGHETKARWQEGCGLNIRAQVLLAASNPELALELRTAMLHQSEMYAHIDATETELKRLGHARREAEVKQAEEAGNVRL